METKKTVGVHAPIVMMLAVMAITAPALVSLGNRIFPGSPVRQIALIGVSEAALILWHVAHNNAKGDKQESISNIMVWVSMFGVCVLAGLDILLEAADAKQIPVQFDKIMIGTVLLVTLICLLAGHLVGAISYMHADPDKEMERESRQSGYTIQREAIQLIKANAKAIAPQLGAIQAQAFVEDAHSAAITRASSQRNALAGSSGGGMFAQQSLPQLSAAPSGPAPAPIFDYDLMAAAMLRAQAGQTAAVVTPMVEAEAPKAKG